MRNYTFYETEFNKNQIIHYRLKFSLMLRGLQNVRATLLIFGCAYTKNEIGTLDKAINLVSSIVSGR